MHTESPAALPDDEIDLRQLAATLWAGRWWVITATSLGAAIAIAFALLSTPVYRAEALTQIRQESKTGAGLSSLAAQLGGVPGFAGLTVGGDDNRALALATLKSRVVVQAFIQEQNLLPVFFDKLWDSERKRWNVEDPKKVPTLWHGYKVFSGSMLKVTEDKKTGLVSIGVEWRDPEAAAAWTTELIARTNAYLRDKSIRESERNLEYLRQQVKQTGVVELQQAVYTLVESELKKLMLAKGGDEYVIKTVDPAQVPQERNRPKRRQIAIIGVLLGGVLGIVAVLARSAFRRPANPAI